VNDNLFWKKRSDCSERLPATNLLTGLAIGIILAGVSANELVIARLVSADGILDATTVFNIRWVQGVLFITGISLLFRKRTALLTLVVALAILNLSVFQRAVKTTVEDDTVVMENRLREIRNALPAEGHVGYISDDILPNAGYVGTKRYYLTQYAVAPIVVEIGTTRDLIIGNFKKSDQHQVPENLVVVRDFGGGLALLRKRAE
jgi:hypothetical protein